MGETIGIRFTVVAHASPIWRGAATAAQADKLNQELSAEREKSVRAVVVRLLQQKLGPGAAIQPGNFVETGPPKGVAVRGYSSGSSEGLKATKGDRQNNDPQYRKVTVTFERTTTTKSKGMTSTGQVSTKTQKWWSLRVDRLQVSPGGQLGEADVTLFNDITGKTVRAKATLRGDDAYSWGITPNKDPKKMLFSIFTNIAQGPGPDLFREKANIKHAFYPNREMGFADFSGETIAFEKTSYSAGLKGHTMRVFFPRLGGDSASMMLSPLGGFGGIGMGHYQVSGSLQLAGVVPDDFANSSQMVSNIRVTQEGDIAVTLIFPTGSSRYEGITAADRAVFEKNIDIYTKLYDESHPVLKAVRPS